MSARPSLAQAPSFQATAWQMTYGERLAFEGLLAQLKPTLAIEIGTAEGGSLARIAEHSAEVHSFDLVAPSFEVADHVTLHPGDSHAELPRFLAQLAAEGRHPDFVLVDGDHSAEGVQQDVEDLLASDAITECVIVLHDTINEEVRAGLEAVDWTSFAKVRYVDLDAVPGRMVVSDHVARRGALWGGLGLAIVSTEHRFATPLEGVLRTNVVSPTRIGLGVRALLGDDVAEESDVEAVVAALRPQTPAPRVRDLAAQTLAAAAASARRRLRG
ncbi:MAG: class I SAM-dependent methyltransferase [Patulibacter minatonensis]